VTDVRPPDGLYRAKWTGTEWVETGEPPEYEPPVSEPTAMDYIADIYAKLVETETLTIGDVPDEMRESVNIVLEADGGA